LGLSFYLISLKSDDRVDFTGGGIVNCATLIVLEIKLYFFRLLIEREGEGERGREGERERGREGERERGGERERVFVRFLSVFVSFLSFFCHFFASSCPIKA
jgi:hypothetical protein